MADGVWLMADGVWLMAARPPRATDHSLSAI